MTELNNPSTLSVADKLKTNYPRLIKILKNVLHKFDCHPSAHFVYMYFTSMNI